MSLAARNKIISRKGTRRSRTEKDFLYRNTRKIKYLSILSENIVVHLSHCVKKSVIAVFLVRIFPCSD